MILRWSLRSCSCNMFVSLCHTVFYPCYQLRSARDKKKQHWQWIKENVIRSIVWSWRHVVTTNHWKTLDTDKRRSPRCVCSQIRTIRTWSRAQAPKDERMRCHNATYHCPYFNPYFTQQQSATNQDRNHIKTNIQHRNLDTSQRKKKKPGK